MPQKLINAIAKHLVHKQHEICVCVCVRLQDASQFLIAKCCCSRFFCSLLFLLNSFFSPCLRNRFGCEEKETKTTTATKYDAKRIVFADKICCWRAISISLTAPKRKPKNFFSAFLSSSLYFFYFSLGSA